VLAESVHGGVDLVELGIREDLVAALGA